MEEKVCCFTGHRPEGFSFGYDEENCECIKIKEKLREEIIKMITQNNVTHFISGMAQGVDIWAAEIVLKLKKDYPNLTITAAIPFPGQSRRWKVNAKIRYDNILNQCDEKKILSERYTGYCMMKRNMYMVDSSDYVIAVFNRELKGGTANTVAYANKMDKKPVIIEC